MCIEMRTQGLPIDSITIGAGVPSLEKANEIIKSMQNAGMSAVGFKPGSVNAIRQVIEIAQHNPTMNILLQWTGGRYQVCLYLFMYSVELEVIIHLKMLTIQSCRRIVILEHALILY